MTYLTKTITLEEVERLVAAGLVQTIWYGAMTCWWTHDPSHVCRELESGLPCDPRGGVLYQVNARTFLVYAQQREAHYGRHGLAAFMASHHLNCQVSKSDSRRTCLSTFEEYNALLDDPEAHDE